MELQEDQVSSSSSSESVSDSSGNDSLCKDVVEEEGETSVVLVPRDEVSFKTMICW